MADERKATVFCAWCRRVIAWGDRGIAHGVCDACLPAVVAELEARLDARANVTAFPADAPGERPPGRAWAFE